MTPPERLQDVTLAERLLAGANACTAHRMPGTAALLREAAAALSVRGDGWVAVADDNRWKAMRKAVAAAKRPDADWYRRNIERDGDTDAMAGPSPTIGQQAVDDDAEMAQQAADEVNPAWWRGNDAAVAILCQKIHAILDGKDDGRGVANEPWESTRRRLLASQPQQGAADSVLHPVYSPENFRFSTTIGQQAVDDAELAEFVRGIYRRMNESYEGGRRILFQDMDYLFDFATKRRIILSQVRAALAAHGKPNA